MDLMWPFVGNGRACIHCATDAYVNDDGNIPYSLFFSQLCVTTLERQNVVVDEQ